MTLLNVLVANDYDGAGLDTAPIVDFLGDALIAHDTETQQHWKTGAPQFVHRFVFSMSVRNTEAHGAGYRAGFVVHCENIHDHELI